MLWRASLHLRLVFGRRGQAAALGFLGQDLVGDDLVAHQLLEVGRQLLVALRGLLLHLADDRVDARLRHRLAVDDGDVLRLDGERREAGGRRATMLAARKFFFMNVPFGRAAC